MRRPLARLVLVALVALASCATPTLPLPPPMDPGVGALTNGQVHLTGGAGSAEANAVIVVLTDDTTLPGDKRVGGAVAGANGSWDAWVYANSGDILEITQQVGDNTSPPAYVQVP